MLNKSSCIQVQSLHKNFNQKPILKNITLTVDPHELTVIIGPSGSGKSTLLRCLNGLENFETGKISIAGFTLEPSSHTREVRKHVGMVFQSFNLFPHLTTIENVMKAPRVVKKISQEEAREIAEKLLEKVGLSTHMNHYPCELSGGQQQRAAIARALAMNPKVMLYDEPTSALDPSLVDEVLQVMRKLHEEGMTQVIVTHQMRFAQDVANKIIYIENGEIVEISAPQKIFSTPSDERTKRFLRHYL